MVRTAVPGERLAISLSRTDPEEKDRKIIDRNIVEWNAMAGDVRLKRLRDHEA